MEDQKSHDVVQILEKFGKYHWYHWTLAVLPSLMVTMANINFVFVAGDINYRCYVPECELRNSTHDFPAWWPNAMMDEKCTRPVLTSKIQNGACSNDSFSDELVQCKEWIYESNDTIVSELNLACQPWKINLVGTIHNIGMLFSMILVGWMLDRFGRKPTLILCGVLSAIGHLKAFSADYYMFVVIEFLEGVVSGGMYLASSVTIIEFSNKSNRLYAGVLLAYIIYAGEIIYAGIAMALPNWKDLIRVIYTPQLFFLTYVFLIKESPRWQVLNGQSEKAKQTLQHIAKMNKSPINHQELKDIDDAKLKAVFNIGSYEVREGYREIFKSKELLKRVFVVCVCKFTVSFIYYGITINSVFLPGNKFTNFFLSTVMSFPGELIALYFMSKIGRKVPLMIGFIICAVMCVTSGYISTPWGKVASFLTGKMVISACFTGVMTYGLELYPTSTRGSLMSFNSFTSRIGAMVAPLTPMLNPISTALPTILFGGTALLSCILLTLTPETKNVALLDTIEQVETMAREARDLKRRTRKKESEMTQSCETVVTKM